MGIPWDVFLKFGMEGMLFGGFLLVLKWVFKVNHQILGDMSLERKMNQEVQAAFSENIKDITATNQTFHKQVDEAHKYQREEHKEMIKSLGRINGYKE